ncbi:SEL1-like repeat protein [Cupriavidus pauculus]
MRVWLPVSLALLICACSNKEGALPSPPDPGAVRTNLAFTCARETDHLPPLDPQTDSLFLYARHLQKQPGPKDFNEMARYYRIAAAHGHYKANHNLQLLVSQGFADSPAPSRETIDLAAQLISLGVPGGYFDMGHYLELGYGVKQDSELALRYFRKAADLGNPEAQSYIAKLLAPFDKAPEIALKMRQCATDQGYGDAANTLGINRQDKKNFVEAILAFQQGVKAGNSLSALALEEGFKGPPQSDRMNFLALDRDAERSHRYKLIGKFIDSSDGRNPKVPDIDKIVPLPPAKLPEWDGTFQWQKEQDAAVPPQKPAEELVQQLAKEKNLDPATGLPLTTSSKAERLPLGTKVRTGERCPQDGCWCVPHVARIKPDATRYFKEGDVMPPLVYEDPRPIPGLDRLLGKRQRISDVGWQLISYDVDA